MSKRIPTSSVSQVQNYRSCQRKWYLSSVDYLPQEPRRATAIGDCIHAVLERYLDVDEQGLKEGKAPDLYPEGWHLQKDYFGKKVLFSLNKEEQATIKRLVEYGIDQGTVIRRPNASVEYMEKIFITPEITFQVRIDYAYDWTIEDHKSCKNFRYTTVEGKTHTRYIGKDVQLKVYAYFWALRQQEVLGVDIPNKLTIRHNQFCVDPKMSNPVRIVETEVTFEECVKEYEELKKVVLEQLEWRKKAAAGEIKFWDMEKDLDTCNAYGGCPYQKVCVSQEMPPFYRNRINAKIDELTELIKIEEEGNNMAFKINDKSGGTKAQDKVLEDIDTAGSAPTVASLTAELAEVAKTAEGMGMEVSATPKGKELMEAIAKLEAVEKKAEAAAKKAEEKAAKEKADAEALAKAKAEDKKVAAEKAELQKNVKEEPTVSDKQAGVELQQEAAAEEKEEAPVDQKGQKPMDYDMSPSISGRSKEVTICIGCYPVSGKQVKTISLYAVFAAQAVQIAKASGAASYYKLDPFKRREQFALAAPSILDELKGLTVIVPSSLGPDEQALLNALLLDKNVRAYSA